MRVVEERGELGREERIDGPGSGGWGRGEEELLLEEGGGEDGVLPGAGDEGGCEEEIGDGEVREDVLEEFRDGEDGGGCGRHGGVVGLRVACRVPAGLTGACFPLSAAGDLSLCGNALLSDCAALR